jgi:oligopeptidase A
MKINDAYTHTNFSSSQNTDKWAEVLSADAFAAFEEVGLDNDTEVQVTGRRFRDTVLSLGGGMHPSDVYRLFRGKDPSPEALLRHSGLL